MVLMGDEYGHSKGGNNNTYCHDSPLNWLDWDAANSVGGAALRRFWRVLVRFRRACPELAHAHYLAGEVCTARCALRAACCVLCCGRVLA